MAWISSIQNLLHQKDTPLKKNPTQSQIMQRNTQSQTMQRNIKREIYKKDKRNWESEEWQFVQRTIEWKEVHV